MTRPTIVSEVFGPAKSNGPPRKKAARTVSLAEAEYTDVANARRLVERHGQDLRYCDPWRKWLVWDGSCWKEDDTREVLRRAKEMIRAMYAEAERLADRDRQALVKHALQTERNVNRIRAALELAKDGVPILPREMDNDAWLLNVANGTIDLRTGEIREHKRGDYITRMSPVAFEPGAACELWTSFLHRIFAGKAELIAFVQRLFGYCLTGDVREQLLIVFHGTGANGKSTLLNLVLLALADYAMKATPELMLLKAIDSHPTERADLFGRRLVVAMETDEGRRLAESLVKELTGGDPIRARRMREDHWQFMPSHKLILCTNHRPVVKGTDHAIWRRIRLVPFDVVIPDAEQDKTLADKLRAELPGILAWCVRGCLDWQRDGLGLPEEVKAATAAYRDEQDVLGAFLAECCARGPHYRIKAGAIYGGYRDWCKRTGETEVKQRTFGMAMTERGFERQDNNGIWYVGLDLRSELKDGGNGGNGTNFPD